MPARQRADRFASERSRQPLQPSVSKIDTFDLGQNIDAYGLYSNLKDDPRYRKVLAGQVVKWCPEGIECSEESVGIHGIRPNPKVQILGCSHMAVDRKSV